MMTLSRQPELGMCINIYLVYPVWVDGQRADSAIGVAAATREQAALGAVAHLRELDMPAPLLKAIAGFAVEHVGTVARPIDPHFFGG